MSNMFSESNCKEYAEWEYVDSSLAAGSEVPLLHAVLESRSAVDAIVENTLKDLHICVMYHDIYNETYSREVSMGLTCAYYTKARSVPE